MSTPNPPQMLELVRERMRQGDYKGAAEICGTILGQDPQQPDALHQMGMIHRRFGNIAAAINCHERALQARPNEAEYLNALGLAYRAASRVSDAIESFEAAIRADPVLVDAYVNVGQTHFARGDFRAAVARFRDAIEFRPAEPHLHVALGYGLAAQNDMRSAEGSFRRAITLDPSYGPAYTGLGDLYRAAGEQRTALKHYQDGIAAAPDEAGNYLKAGPLFATFGEFDAAVNIVREGIKRRPRSGVLHVAMARLMMRQERWDEAWASYPERMAVPPLLNERNQFVQPHWDGREPSRLTICVHFEPNLEESLALLRYVDLLIDAGASVILRCPALVAKLLAPLKGRMEICATTESMPAFDRQVWLGDLPRLLIQPAPNTLPPAPRGFDAIADDRTWAERCRDLPRPLVGLHWRSPTPSRIFSDMRTLLSIFSNFSGGLIALQDRTAGPDIVGAGLLERMVHVGAELPNESDIASALAGAAAQCDLVVSVDSPVVAVAGMLRRPVLALIDGSEDFPWPLDRIETGWFPSVAVLHRKPGDDDLRYLTRIQAAIDAVAAPAA